ncbi:MAG: NUDIX domain-containing protein, partial [Chloroflexi bacterium]|nr:NUDIX domain-containing protein [Chloroflexota bacterium]
KTIEDLWHELCQGDSQLQKSPLLRRVNVAQVIIRRNQYMLMETVQEFKSGRRRFRNQPPSEKMKRNESFKEAAIRCLEEELGISGINITFNESSYSRLDTITDSKSYPGLPTEYVFHRMEITIPELPTHNFWRNNLSFANGDPIKRHFWSWMPWDGKTHWQPT